MPYFKDGFIAIYWFPAQTPKYSHYSQIIPSASIRHTVLDRKLKAKPYWQRHCERFIRRCFIFVCKNSVLPQHFVFTFSYRLTKTRHPDINVMDFVNENNKTLSKSEYAQLSCEHIRGPRYPLAQHSVAFWDIQWNIRPANSSRPSTYTGAKCPSTKIWRPLNREKKRWLSSKVIRQIQRQTQSRFLSSGSSQTRQLPSQTRDIRGSLRHH